MAEIEEPQMNRLFAPLFALCFPPVAPPSGAESFSAASIYRERHDSRRLRERENRFPGRGNRASGRWWTLDTHDGNHLEHPNRRKTPGVSDRHGHRPRELGRPAARRERFGSGGGIAGSNSRARMHAGDAFDELDGMQGAADDKWEMDGFWLPGPKAPALRRA